MRRLSLVLCFLGSCTTGQIDGWAPEDEPSDGVDEGDVGDSEPLDVADDTQPPATENPALPVDSMARVCNADALSLRLGPGSDYEVLATMPSGSTTRIISFTSGWYKNDWGGRVGWSSAEYLCPIDPSDLPDLGDVLPSFEVLGSPTRLAALAISRAAVGFSYFWGGGRFATGAPAGSCYGSCPSCNHSGSYGADCSGFAAKAWLLPEALPMDSNKHPYSTAEFNSGGGPWTDVSRANLLQMDAMVYRSGGAGHILLFDSGDAWGQLWAYEARGCSYGVVHNLRSVGSSYKGIKRNGL